MKNSSTFKRFASQRIFSFSFFIFTLLVLILQGCGSVRKSVFATFQNKSDSTIYREIVKIDTVRIKADSNVVVWANDYHFTDEDVVKLNDAFELKKAKTKSRANVQFKIVHDSIYIEGTCDSAEILTLQRTIETLTSKNEKVLDKREEIKDKKWSVIALILYVLLGLIVFSFLSFIPRK